MELVESLLAILKASYLPILIIGGLSLIFMIFAYARTGEKILVAKINWQYAGLVCMAVSLPLILRLIGE